MKDKCVIVTGASSGIGAGIAHAFARAGANLFITCKNSVTAMQAVAIELRKQYGVTVHTGQMNLEEHAQIAVVLKEAHRALGKIDVLVNNAGADILTGKGAALHRREKIAYLLNADLAGTMHACWAALPLLEPSGCILNMSWDLALHGFKGENPQLFAASKAGIIGFSRALAKSSSVRVNVLAPGWIQTRFAEENMDAAYYQERLQEIPLGRFGTPEDVAEAALFLASDAASYITGSVLCINGGAHLRG